MILDADATASKRFGGHGSAMAQVYNHIIMPLANARDRVTQIRWGIADFETRFQRKPEGMWLPETAVDTETLDLLAAEGIQFTVLAPHQCARIRPLTEVDTAQGENEGQPKMAGPTRRMPPSIPPALIWCASQTSAPSPSSFTTGRAPAPSPLKAC